ncbi:MAG: hypothetical protein ACTHOO_01865 [Alcanivorax sp.]
MHVTERIKTAMSKKAVMGATIAVVAVASVWGVKEYVMPSSDNAAEVRLSNFKPGTQVDYRILAGKDVLQQNSKKIEKDGVLALPIDKKSIKDTAQRIVQYELNMRGPDFDAKAASDEALRVLLNLDKATGDVSVSASGLDEYAGVEIDNAGRHDELAADWAGKFSAKLGLPSDPKDKGDQDAALKMAFQNAGITSDIENLNPGQIEVFFGLFGDSSGSNLSAVQSRWSSALIRMSLELTTVMVMQTEAIGMFIDARIQLKTQRKHQELMARAHKDYHPSEQMCRIGTFIRSVAHSETKGEVDKHFLNKMLMDEYMGVENTAASHSLKIYENAKIQQYADVFCDQKDNDSAASAICDIVGSGTPGQQLARLNKDVDYTRTLAVPLTLDVDFTDATATGDEEDVIALVKNLYFPSNFDISDIESVEKDPRGHYASRSYAAKMGVAHNTFINIVGMKARAPEGQATTATASAPPPPSFGDSTPPTTRPAPTALAEDAGWAYMKALLREFGLQPIDMNGNGSTTDSADMTIEDQIDEILGERPSYYAQMEVLTKKIYQSPNFYTNLYDKPANVKRIGASLDAITIMHQRDRFESLLRREMLTSVLVEEALAEHVEEVNANMYEAMQASQISD